jgi:hypothetical protein
MKKYVGILSPNQETIIIDIAEFIDKTQPGGLDEYISGCDYFVSNSKTEILSELTPLAIYNIVSISDDTERQEKLLNENKKMFEAEIYFHRGKEDNQEIVDMAEEHLFDDKSIEKLRYLGYELNMKVRITDDYTKIIEVEGKNIEDKDIYI